MKIEIKKNCIRSDNRNCHCYGNRKCWGLKWRSTIAGRTRPNFELFERVSGAANQSSAQRTKYNMDYLRRCWLLCFRLFWGRYIWWLSCPEQESNLHSLARTRFWVWRVYQFRHPGFKEYFQTRIPMSLLSDPENPNRDAILHNQAIFAKPGEGYFCLNIGIPACWPNHSIWSEKIQYLAR